MAGVGAEAVESVEELQPVREAVADCIDQLSEQDRFIVDAINTELISYEELGKRLGVSKPHAWRLRNAAYERLKYHLSMHPVLRRRIRVAETWEESAKQWVCHIDMLAKTKVKINMHSLSSIRDRAAITIREGEELSPMFWTSVAGLVVSDLKERGLWSVDSMVLLLVKKQNDYGHGNILKFGLFGVFVRFSDKVERLINLSSALPLSEPYEDALWDIVGYCVIALMLNDETFGLELGENTVEKLSSNSRV